MTVVHHILLLDPDDVLRQLLTEHLAAAGYQVTALSAIPEHIDTDLIVVDSGLADALKETGIPLIVLGNGPNALPKPIRLGTLLARLREALSQDGTICLADIGPWHFDPATRCLRHEDGRAVRLTDKEASILAYLQKDGGVVSRETLLCEVWGYSSGVTSHTLETHVYRLRRKIEDNPATAIFLLTEDGGYRLASGCAA